LAFLADNFQPVAATEATTTGRCLPQVELRHFKMKTASRQCRGEYLSNISGKRYNLLKTLGLS
jgi:hypothetical protein